MYSPDSSWLALSETVQCPEHGGYGPWLATRQLEERGGDKTRSSVSHRLKACSRRDDDAG
jgi:hypothetical protein